MSLFADAGSEQYRTHSSTGFEPILEGMSTSDPYIARAHTGGYHRAPPSDRGSQVDFYFPFIFNFCGYL